RRHTRSDRDWSSDVCSSDLASRRGCRAFGESRARHHGPEARACCQARFRLRRAGMTDLTTLTIAAARAGLKKKEFSAAELAEARSEERRVGKEGSTRWRP